MSRITLHLKHFGRRSNCVIHHDEIHKPFGHRRFPSPDPLVSVGPPTFAMPQVTFIHEHSNDAPAVPATSENDPYFAMDTFRTETATKECDA